MKNWWIALWSLAGIGCIGPGFFLPAFALLVPAFLLFAAGAMGAGDGKLMAVIVGYLGFWNGMYAIGTGMAIGALWSLYRLWRSRSLRTRLFYLFAWFRRMLHTKELIQYGNTSEEKPERVIPLAACMAAGTYFYLLGSWIGTMPAV